MSETDITQAPETRERPASNADALFDEEDAELAEATKDASEFATPQNLAALREAALDSVKDVGLSSEQAPTGKKDVGLSSEQAPTGKKDVGLSSEQAHTSKKDDDPPAEEVPVVVKAPRGKTLPKYVSLCVATAQHGDKETVLRFIAFADTADEMPQLSAPQFSVRVVSTHKVTPERLFRMLMELRADNVLR